MMDRIVPAGMALSAVLRDMKERTQLARWESDQDTSLTRRQRTGWMKALQSVTRMLHDAGEPYRDRACWRVDFEDGSLVQGYRNASLQLGNTSIAVHLARCGWVVTVHTLGMSKKTHQRATKEQARAGFAFVDRDLAAEWATAWAKMLFAPTPSA